MATRHCDMPVTAESIAEAKAATQAERAAAMRHAPGLVITDEGATVAVKPWHMGCPRPGCPFVAHTRSEHRLVPAITAHLLYGHFREHLRGTGR